MYVFDGTLMMPWENHKVYRPSRINGYQDQLGVHGSDPITAVKSADLVSCLAKHRRVQPCIKCTVISFTLLFYYYMAGLLHRSASDFTISTFSNCAVINAYMQ